MLQERLYTSGVAREMLQLRGGATPLHIAMRSVCGVACHGVCPADVTYAVCEACHGPSPDYARKPGPPIHPVQNGSGIAHRCWGTLRTAGSTRESDGPTGERRVHAMIHGKGYAMMRRRVVGTDRIVPFL